MWPKEKMVEYLKAHLKENRFKHTLGVVKAAEELSKKYGCDENKAKLGALLHDVAKNMCDKEIIEILKKENYKLDFLIKNNPQIIHGFCSAYIAKHVMNVTDEEVLQAIIYHTTGKEDMTILEKVIYLADFIEENRVYPGVEELRKLAKEDLDKALLKAFDNTIEFVVKKGEYLHLDTIKARNYILKNM